MRNYVYQIVARDVGKVVATDIVRFARELKTIR